MVLDEKLETPETTPPIPKGNEERNLSIQFSVFSVDFVNWLPKDARVGQAIVYYNIAAIYAITNDVDKAFKYFNLV